MKQLFKQINRIAITMGLIKLAEVAFDRRVHIGETPFAIIKGILEVRRFLLRGLEKVRMEWRWVCTGGIPAFGESSYGMKPLRRCLC